MGKEYQPQTAELKPDYVIIYENSTGRGVHTKMGFLGADGETLESFSAFVASNGGKVLRTKRNPIQEQVTLVSVIETTSKERRLTHFMLQELLTTFDSFNPQETRGEG